MAKNKTVGTPSDNQNLEKALLSIGADKVSVERLVSTKLLEDIVIPLYWKDGLVSNSHLLWLVKLPGFLRGFEEEFPDGQVRWDAHYESSDPSLGDIALRIYFNYQEDDQGDHWSPPPTLLEEESYRRMLTKATFKGEKPLPASKVVR
jgi:hypothetical protein